MTIDVVRDRAQKMKHVVHVRQHALAVDEPEANGGEDLGPTPHEVYDSALGGLTWSSGQPTQCTDLITTTNQVACFSNSASYLSLLAPGALITAGGFSLGGTSQAAPHVAGALAVLRAGFPEQTRAAVEAQLGATGTAHTSHRSSGRL